MSRNYRSDSCPLENLMVLKLAYLPSKLRFSDKDLFQEHQISAGQLSADSSSTETLCCLNGCAITMNQLLNKKSSPPNLEQFSLSKIAKSEQHSLP